MSIFENHLSIFGIIDLGDTAQALQESNEEIRRSGLLKASGWEDFDTGTNPLEVFVVTDKTTSLPAVCDVYCTAHLNEKGILRVLAVGVDTIGKLGNGNDGILILTSVASCLSSVGAVYL